MGSNVPLTTDALGSRARTELVLPGERDGEDVRRTSKFDLDGSGGKLDTPLAPPCGGACNYEGDADVKWTVKNSKIQSIRSSFVLYDMEDEIADVP
ncbi:unnamed protein product [Danaus chrysippus]|uniref:(African queen) hypothetical protein n=1 Tax=Danaus chrysippus TaxID=151541 RepID=A0A8J2QSB0_9NEOP|nr:unnamed protein product [Danaus chrysippus]